MSNTLDRAPAADGTLTAKAVGGAVIAGAVEGRTVRFGRNPEAVDVCVGADDDQVSRRHGLLVCRRGVWWLSNTGRGPLELPDRQWLHPSEEPVPLRSGFTTLFVLGSRNREHLLELYVSGQLGAPAPSRYLAATRPVVPWRLESADERLVLTALGQPYLYNRPDPVPLTRQQVAELLNDVPGQAGWTDRKVEHVIKDVRDRLSAAGVRGLQRSEVGEPVGNTLSHNLLRELLRSTTIGPADLALLDD